MNLRVVDGKERSIIVEVLSSNEERGLGFPPRPTLSGKYSVSPDYIAFIQEGEAES